MAQTKSSASEHRPVRKSSRCEVCGVSSHEKTLVGLKNDRRRDGLRYCLAHHPDSMAGSVRFAGLGPVAAELSLSAVA